MDNSSLDNSQLVTHDDWNKWKWRAVVAFITLGLSMGLGLYLIVQERNDRIDTASVIIKIRCQEARENRLAIRKILLVEISERKHVNDENNIAIFKMVQRTLPPIQNCNKEAKAIKDLVD